MPPWKQSSNQQIAIQDTVPQQRQQRAQMRSCQLEIRRPYYNFQKGHYFNVAEMCLIVQCFMHFISS